MTVARRVVVIAIAVVLAGCGSNGPTPTPTPTPTPAARADQAGTTGQADTAPVMSLPWPSGSHTWSSGPHGYYKGRLCLPADACAKDVPIDIRAGLDFGTGGKDWDVYPVAAGTVLYKGTFTDGFGAAVVIDHGGGIAVLYGHMDEGSLSAAPDQGRPVTRGTKLGRTWCTGMDPCTATSTNHHLHLELRALTTRDGVASWTTPLGWSGQTIGGWTISVPPGTINYYGSATACGTTLTVDAGPVPSIYDATDCSTAAGPTPTPTPAPVLAASWSAPKDGAKLTTSTLKLSATASFGPATESVSKVAFTIRWGSTTKEACTATKAGSDRAWSCKVDLWSIGAPLGKLTVSFDVTDSAGDVANESAGTRTVAFAAPPPKPTDASYSLVSSQEVDPSTGETDWVYRVAWSIPDGAADEITIWGVTGCYTSKEGQPCVAPGMSIPSGDRFKIGTVQGGKQSYLYRFTTGWEANWPDIMKAVLVQAHNRYGYSKSAIAWWLCFGNDDATVMCHP